MRNKDIETLECVVGAMQMVRALEEKLEWARERRFQITQHFSFSHGGVRSGMDDALGRIDELEAEHREQVKRYIAEIKRAQRIVDGISDVRVRAFVVLMYVEQLPGAAVRRELNLTRRTFDRLRQAVEEAEHMCEITHAGRLFFE